MLLIVVGGKGHTGFGYSANQNNNYVAIKLCVMVVAQIYFSKMNFDIVLA